MKRNQILWIECLRTLSLTNLNCLIGKVPRRLLLNFLGTDRYFIRRVKKLCRIDWPHHITD
jgi:hypothetical protein